MKKVIFMGSSLEAIRRFPKGARTEAGYAIELAQRGDRAINSAPMKGFGSAKVVEVVIQNDGNAYRAIYTVKYGTAVYVLHAFQKKSKRGRQTSREDMRLIDERLKDAGRLHKAMSKSKNLEKKNVCDSG